MRIDILSIFPHMFDGFLNESIIKRAIQKKIVEINIHDFREFSKDPHKKVDDYQFGGGAGMILMPEPIYDCVESIRDDDSYIILMTPQGVSYNQKKANELKESAEDLVSYAKEKATPVVQDAAEALRKKAIDATKSILDKLES